MRALFAAIVSCLFVACSDPPLCESDVVVVIRSPTSSVTSDLDAVATGVQTPVEVRTNLLAGTSIQLDILDASQTVVGTESASVDATGVASFASVTVPSPTVTLRATGTDLCGIGQDSVTLDVTAGVGCDITLSPQPAANAFYAPLAVFAAAADPDPVAAGFQVTLAVATHPGWTVELFETTATGEQQLGSLVADATGRLSIVETLLDGEVGLRASCRGGEGTADSPTTTVIVDTTPPTCAVTVPAPGTTITPSLDLDHDLSNGVQLGVEVHVTGNDVAGEVATLVIDPGSTPVSLPVVDATGTTAGTTTLAPATTPATFMFELDARDHAGNTCSTTTAYDVAFDGCAIAVVSPVLPVTADADLDASNGSQLDVVLAVDPACAGRTVTSSCGINSPTGTVAGDGSLSLRVDACATSPCQTTDACTFTLTNAIGVQTSVGATLVFDDQGPQVTVGVVAPPLPCGSSVTAGADVDPNTEGVQVTARVTADAASETLRVTNFTGVTSFDASHDVTLTLSGGANTLVGIAADSLGNLGQSSACTISLDDLTISFSPPAADGVLARADGTVSGNQITLPLCGSVSKLNATVQLTIDGAPPVAATVNGSTWCRTVTFAETPPSHTISASATSGSSTGQATLVLAVDLTPPDPITTFTAATPNRERIEMTWTAPSDGGHAVDHYVLKQSTSPLSDGNFDTTGTVLVTGTPKLPGAAEAAEVFPAHTGTTLWFAIASVDAAGNRAAVASVGPITPAFDQTGAIVSPNAAQGSLSLGFAIAHGKLNDDAFDDLAIAAPTQNIGAMTQAGAVYVYFGGPAGIASTPSLTITGTASGQHLGTGLAALAWSSSTRDDLAIGADGADGGAGRIFIFNGGAAFPTADQPAGTAGLQIAVDPVTPGVFAGGHLGHVLAAADFDGDGTVDLVVGAPKAAAGGGAVAVIYGGTPHGNVLVSDIDPTGANGAVVDLFEDPLAGSHQLGTFVHAVGPTQGLFDHTDDLVIAYADDTTTAGDSLFVVRGAGVRPSVAGVTARPFTVGLDVRIDLVTASFTTEWGAQATSIGDQDGDGRRDLVLGAYLNRSNSGQVLIVDGGVLGTSGIAKSTDPGIVRTTITGTGRFGAAIVERDDGVIADVDGDGLDDLLVAGLTPAGVATLYVWFGGAIPTGAIAAASATYQIAGPSLFKLTRQAASGLAAQARWIGDINGDGLDDVCWAAPFDNTNDGSFEVLFDAP